ncbi:uncharacterized protein IL334_001248 [Kwoniella shivajii]|uniref:Uncharacterized protein n=1 Tax=Kwoniella shivajii TaxID=564305 RepID=A0ABZ1CRE5_9TREE|nr:hypothetical protein IL334_001248 [Kwoniella shivajii]
MSLPYDATPPPSPPRGSVMEEENPALDRPLDDYQPSIPDHVQSLMGRMSRGKVYLMEESPGIIHLDGNEKLRRDPRIAALAERLDKQDPTSWLEAISAGAPSPIKPIALYIRSDLIQHLSTSKVFSWTSGLGAGVMGIEWLNDTTLHLIFPTPAAALLGLTVLSKAGFDPAEGDDPLLERAAHSVPISLLPLAEPEPVPSLEGQELLSGSSDSTSNQDGGIKRKGRGNFGSKSSSGVFDLEPLVNPETSQDPFKLAEGIDPHARIAIRYGTEADQELRKEAKASQWYKRHGRNAGKEIASSKRSIGDDRYQEEEGMSLKGRGSGEGRDFAKRLGRERRDQPYGNRPGNRGKGRRTEEDLDKELENIAKRRTAGEEGISFDEDVEMDSGSADRRRDDRRGGRRGGGRRGENKKEDLDKELDELFAARSTNP